MKKIFILASLMLISFITYAQSTSDTVKPKKPAFGISFGGYVKSDVFYDSRQIVGARDNQFLLYPEPVKNDPDGNDINARSDFNMLTIQTRLAGTITGPDALGAKTSGFLEAEFFGNINQNINTFRLRHAYVALNWKKAELLVGQTWHPIFSPFCFPSTVSFNTGAMFTAFSRNPQVRFIRYFGNFSVAGIIMSQLDFTSTGPEGPTSKYARNSAVPEMNIQLMYRKKDDVTGKEFLIGAGIDYLTILPRLSSSVVVQEAIDTVINNLVIHQPAVTVNYKTGTTVSTFSYNIMAKLTLKKVSFRAAAFYGENAYGFTMLGGYAVKNVTDAVKGFVDYAAIRTFTTWAEISSTNKKWQPAIFAGFTRNLGAGEEISGPYYSRGADIDYIYRISPRLVRDFKKVRIAGEIEYTVAAYGKTGTHGYVHDSSEVGNLRFLIGVYYFF